MHVIRRRGWELPEHAATCEPAFLSRRAIVGGGLVLALQPLLGSANAAVDADPTADLYPAKRNGKYLLDRPVTDENVNGAYNNFYDSVPQS